MKPTTLLYSLLISCAAHISAIEVDCSMSDTTPCDCIYNASPTGTLAGTDCRVCRVVGQLACVLWGSVGDRYGPLCEDQHCPEGSSWEDEKNTPGKCYCDWQPKVHERMPCTSPAGDCKCLYNSVTATGNLTTGLPGETCTVCVEGDGDAGWFCTENGNKKNKYGPLCMGDELGPQCTGNGCVCNWMVTMDGPAWRNDTTGV